jgi:hypothetical protein
MFEVASDVSFRNARGLEARAYALNIFGHDRKESNRESF